MHKYITNGEIKELGVVVCALYFSTWGGRGRGRGKRQVGLWEFEASLSHIANARPARATQ